MGPLRIHNRGAYADRIVQDWHRNSVVLGRSADAIDIDLMGCCKHPHCREPLYLIEASSNPDKPTSIIKELARRANVPAFLILHTATQSTECPGCNGLGQVNITRGVVTSVRALITPGSMPRWLWSNPTTEEGVARILLDLRRLHYDAKHGDISRIA